MSEWSEWSESEAIDEARSEGGPAPGQKQWYRARAQMPVPETPKEWYDLAKREVAMLPVVVSQKARAQILKQAAKDMERAGAYKDAPMLAERYFMKSRRMRRRDKRQRYDRAVERMQTAQTESERRYVLDVLGGMPNFRDAGELALAFEKKIRKEERAARVRNALTVVAVILAMAGLLLLLR